MQVSQVSTFDFVITFHDCQFCLVTYQAYVSLKKKKEKKKTWEASLLLFILFHFYFYFS